LRIASNTGSTLFYNILNITCTIVCQSSYDNDIRFYFTPRNLELRTRNSIKEAPGRTRIGVPVYPREII
jgi:hypothetical protein